MKKILIILSVIAVLLAFVFGYLLGYYRSYNAGVHFSEEAPPAESSAPHETSAPRETSPPSEGSLKELEGALRQELSGYRGEWAIYVKNLKSGESFEIGNKKMVAASMIKLFIMAKVYEDIDSGVINDTNEVRKLLKDMITVSNNQASNDLVALIGGGDFKRGMAQVNAFAASRKYTDTLQERDMQDFRPVPIPEQNYTSVLDCGRLLDAIYNKTCVSQDADREMLDLLLGQTRRWKIPAGLPAGVKSANKTGELSDVENDAAIVFSESCDYILCVFSNEVPDSARAQNAIVSISETVYRYFSEINL